MVLRIRELEAACAEIARERSERRDAREVVAVQHDVQRERQTARADGVREGELLREDGRARDRVGARGRGVLHGELDAVEPGVRELAEPLRVDRHAGRDEVRVQLARGRGAHDLGQVAAQRRLAAREPDVDDAELARLAERARPAICTPLKERAS